MGRPGDQVRDQLVVSRGTLRLQDTHAFLGIKPCILAPVAEIDEVGSGS
jgi:hypothetical protein